MRLLGIETSCDETAVALVDVELGSQARIVATRIASQVREHDRFGGIVPEIATREHLRNLPRMVPEVLEESQTSLDDLQAVAVTVGPGLASSLLVGASYARGLGVAADIPVYGLNHLEGHLYSPFLAHNRGVEFPFVGLIVSGGHTLLASVYGWGRYVKLGSTVDDAAGEAFDKVARLLGFPYPGGPEIEKAARYGNPDAYAFPRAFPERGNFNFSFSGLKTAVRYFFEKNPHAHQDREWIADICASFQRAIVDVLARKAVTAVAASRTHRLVAAGGVICNATLRAALETACKENGIELLLADAPLCTDNAAMIAAAAAERLSAGQEPERAGDINPSLSLFAAEPAGDLARGLRAARILKERQARYRAKR
jgi:N6-L-threonylcarbamoyladenine synthase